MLVEGIGIERGRSEVQLFRNLTFFTDIHCQSLVDQSEALGPGVWWTLQCVLFGFLEP